MRRLSGVRAYTAAILLVIAAFILRFALDPVLHGHGPFLIFVLAVAGAALSGGWRPGLLATILSVVSAIWFFVEPRHTFAVADGEEWVYLVLFLAESAVFCVVCERLRRSHMLLHDALESERAARDRAESAAAGAAEELRLRRIAEIELKRSNEDLERFALVVSHDIKEPLRTIRSDALEIVSGTTGTIGLAGRIVKTVERIQLLVTDLLEYARVNQVSVVSDTPVPLDDVLKWTRANLATLIEETSAELTTDALPAIRAEFSVLSALLQNLITNAIKYRTNAPPRIHVGAERASDVCTISVQDNGIGIDPAFRETIFSVFKRLHGREVPGTGVGLSICRRIVERLGGHIWVEPGPEGGSCFRFNVPAMLVEQDSEPSVQQASSSQT